MSDYASEHVIGYVHEHVRVSDYALERAHEHAHDYVHDGNEIYRRSFATIRQETDLSAFKSDVATVVVRMIHSCGMTDLADDVVCSDGVVARARRALQNGAPILCDATMVASGITRSRLPATNQVLCTLTDPGVPELAVELGTTRSAAALELWRPHLAGAVVAIGNAPTALFHLLELLEAGAGRPAAIIGIPVGFIGAAESKHALATHALAGAESGFEYLTVSGRRGGSAITAAAINALACERE